MAGKPRFFKATLTETIQKINRKWLMPGKNMFAKPAIKLVILITVYTFTCCSCQEMIQ